MADEEHLKTLRQGVGAWNRWRKTDEDVDPDLSGADLSGAMLEFADLCSADLRGANLESAQLKGAWLAHAKFEDCKLPDALEYCNLLCADLSGCDLSGMDLSGSHFDEGNLRGADLRGAALTSATLGSTRLQDANLEGAKLIAAYLSDTELEGAQLRSCDLSLAKLVEPELGGAKLAGAIFDRTILARVDLSAAKGLSAAYHEGPSTVGTDTIERTLAAARGDAKRRQDCVNFFRGAGIPEHLLEHYRYLGDPPQPYERTYIVYERSDKDFARMLYDELQAWGVRCWLEERAGSRWTNGRVFRCIHSRNSRPQRCSTVSQRCTLRSTASAKGACAAAWCTDSMSTRPGCCWSQRHRTPGTGCDEGFASIASTRSTAPSSAGI